MTLALPGAIHVVGPDELAICTGSSDHIFFRTGDSVYNKAAGSFQVAGVTMWLTPQEVERAVNLSQTAMAVAQECADLICSGYAAMRSSKVLTQTSWGGGELTFT
jgi:hypothetical protein